MQVLWNHVEKQGSQNNLKRCPGLANNGYRLHLLAH
uniref:Uncharacterized protein n=1 Tax=Anguilla anguilla TaxID=7936 RepID=A0A0E9S381_ANGAN